MPAGMETYSQPYGHNARLCAIRFINYSSATQYHRHGCSLAASCRMPLSMCLDVKTLFLLTIDVEAILGLLLLFVWMQNTAIRAVAWWGCAHLLRAASVALYGMYGSVTDLITIDLADAI